MARSSPYVSISGCNRAIQDTWRANLAAKAPFCVEGPEIMHGAKMLPTLRGLSRYRGAGRGPANWPNGLCALQPGPGPLAACAGLCHLVSPAATRARRAHHPPLPFARPRRTPTLPLLARPHSSPPPFTSRPPCPLRREPGDITRHVVHRSRGGEPLIGRPRRPVVIRARARRLRFPLPGPTTCASRCPLQPRATRVPRPSRTLRGLRHLRPPSASRTAANERNCAASSMRA